MSTYTQVIAPVNLVESVPPNVNSPFLVDVVVVGAKDMPISSDVMVPWLNRLSVTVGMEEPLSGDKVPTVKSTGPILKNNVRLSIRTYGHFTHPRIPSNPVNPLAKDATPMD